MNDLDQKIDVVDKKVDTLVVKIDKFIDQYELDMRGDMNTGNGKRGIVGDIRLIKKYQKDYPSILWLLKNSPIKTVGTLLAIFIFLMTLYQFGMMEFLLRYFGVPIP